MDIFVILFIALVILIVFCIKREENLQTPKTREDGTSINMASDVVGRQMCVQRSNVTIYVHNNNNFYNVQGRNIIIGDGKISEESTDMQVRLQMLEKKNGLHYYYIKDFSDMKQEALLNRSDSEGQRQFDFVCRYGYKIRVSAYIRCRALHFRCQVLAGENDASLQWPFCPRIVFTIADREDATQNIRETDKSKTDTPTFNSPEANVYECNQVFPLDDFDFDRYVKGDAICIMIHIKRQLL